LRIKNPKIKRLTLGTGVIISCNNNIKIATVAHNAFHDNKMLTEIHAIFNTIFRLAGLGLYDKSCIKIYGDCIKYQP
jgi:hypothetical protein